MLRKSDHAGKTVLILGPTSLTYETPRVGMHFLAYYLAELGYKVTYIGGSTNFFHFFKKNKPSKFTDKWFKGKNYIKVCPNLTEYFFRNIFPFKTIICYKQLLTYTFLEKKFLSQKFDILITDISSLCVLSDKINATIKILRLNDLPGGSKAASKYIKIKIDEMLLNNVFDQIWSVVDGFKWYLQQLNASGRNIYLPNGVDVKLFSNFDYGSKKVYNRAVFIGTFNDWFDIDLLNKTAYILKDWQFDIYGVGVIPNFLGQNIKYCGEADYRNLPTILREYSVGILPFMECLHVQYSESSLKYYQYVACGLGVATTDIGMLRVGMSEFACFGGNTAEEFAQAIINAQLKRASYEKEKIVEFIHKNSWDKRLKEMNDLLEILIKNKIN